MNVWANRTAGWGVIPAIGLVTIVSLAIALLPLTWAALLVIGSIVFVITLVRPQVGVLLIVPAISFGSLRQLQLGMMKVGVTEALVLLVLAAWLMRMIADREIRIAWPPLSLPLLIFFGALLLSTVGTFSLQHSVKEMVKWLEVLALYVLVANKMHGRWAKGLIFVVLGTGALAALQGIYQFLFRVGPDAFVLFDRFMRAHGTFEQPNPYAGYLGLTLPVAVGLVAAVLVPVGNRVRVRWLALALGSGVLMLLGLIMTWSRGAWLGLGAAFGPMVLAVVARSGRAAVLIIVLLVVLGYVLLAGGIASLPPSIVQRFSDFVPYAGMTDVRGVEITDANFAVLERMAHWQSALEMWTDHPWLGVGAGNYEAVYDRYALPLWPQALGHAHNYYLNIAAESGVVGLMAYLLLMGAALFGAWRATREAQGWFWGVALGIWGMLVYLCVHSMFDNLYVHGMYLQVAILLGIRTWKGGSQKAD